MPHSIFAPLLTAVLLSAGTPPATVTGHPQHPTSPAPRTAIATMRVDIWPEYDDPRVLVIYDGTLAGDATAPTDFSLVVPPGAQVHMAGGIAPDGGHLHADFRTRTRNDGLVEVSYRLEVPEFYMEFYYDPLGAGEERRFTYPVQSGFHIDSLAVRVQEPRRAEGFEVVPLADQHTQDDRGLGYAVIRRTDLAPGAMIPVTVVYRKTDRTPSVTAQEMNGAQGAQGAQGARAEPPFPWDRARRWGLGILAAAFFAVGLYREVFARRWSGSHREPVADRDRDDRGQAAPEGGRRPRFCTECGTRLAPTHRFCTMCGQPIRGRVAGTGTGGRRR